MLLAVVPVDCLNAVLLHDRHGLLIRRLNHRKGDFVLVLCVDHRIGTADFRLHLTKALDSQVAHGIGLVERERDRSVQPGERVRRGNHRADRRGDFVLQPLFRGDAVKDFHRVGIGEYHAHPHLLEADLVVLDLAYLHLVQPVVAGNPLVVGLGHVEEFIGEIAVRLALVFGEQVAHVLLHAVVGRGQVL